MSLNIIFTRRRGRLIAVAIAMALAVLFIQVVAVAAPAHAATTSRQRVLLPLESAAIRTIVTARAGLDASEDLLDSSVGHTEADSSRSNLNVAAQTTESAIGEASDWLAQLASYSASGGRSAPSVGFAHSATNIDQAFQALVAAMPLLQKAQAAVTASEKSRSEQLQRAEAVARAAVARAAAAVYQERVWTSGFQAQINACRGAVDLTATYGVAVIGEEWGCGGSRFPAEGKLVRLSGVRAGLFRVGPVVAVLNAYKDSTANIPRGYGLLYQTCRNGNAHTETFTELIPVS